MPTDSILSPEEWRVIDVGVVDKARSQALIALSSDGAKKRVEERLAAFYDVSGNYAGASFAALPTNDPQDVTAADLHAVSLLSVDIGPAATRRLLNSGQHRDAVLGAWLGSRRLPACRQQACRRLGRWSPSTR